MCLSLFKKNSDLSRNLDIFFNNNADKNDLLQSGLNFLLALYGCPRHIKDINLLRYTLYNRITARQGLKSTFNLATLPPSEDSAQQHVLRTYFQVLSCKNISIYFQIILYVICFPDSRMDWK